MTELAKALARHLQGPRRIAWVEMPLGPVLATGGEMARADVRWC